MFLVGQVSGLVENSNIGIFSDTINVTSVKVCKMVYHALSFTASLHFQWPWHYFKVTAVPNSFNWKFHVHILLSWNFVQLLITSSRSWIYHYFLLSHIFKGDSGHVFWFDKTLSLAFSRTLFKLGFSNFAG